MTDLARAAQDELDEIRDVLEEWDWLNEDESLVAAIEALCEARNDLAKELDQLKGAIP